MTIGIEDDAPVIAAERPSEPEPTRLRIIRHPGQENMSQRVRPAFTKGELVVKFQADAIAPMREKALAGKRFAAPAALKDPMTMLEQRAGLKGLRPLFQSSGGERRRAAASKNDAALWANVARTVEGGRGQSLKGFAIAELDEDAIDQHLINTLASSEAVEFVERVPNRWTCDVSPATSRQWALHAIQWFTAAKPAMCDFGVAIFDTGIDTKHPDLQRAVVTYDHDGNDDADHMGHGTHVAGIVAAVAQGSIGVTGVAGCPLHCIKVFDDPAKPGEEGVFNFEYYANKLNEMLDGEGKTRVINLSLGGTEKSKAEESLFKELVGANILICAAMGNEHDNAKLSKYKRDISYPAMFDDVLAVGAIDEADRRAGFSEVGKHIGLMAPGVRVLSTTPRYLSLYADELEYDSWPGTSMACPHVAAAAVLVWNKFPKLTAIQVRDKLFRTAVKVARMNGQAFTEEYGHGLLNLEAALR